MVRRRERDAQRRRFESTLLCAIVVLVVLVLVSLGAVVVMLAERRAPSSHVASALSSDAGGSDDGSSTGAARASIEAAERERERAADAGPPPTWQPFVDAEPYADNVFFAIITSRAKRELASYGNETWVQQVPRENVQYFDERTPEARLPADFGGDWFAAQQRWVPSMQGAVRMAHALPKRIDWLLVVDDDVFVCVRQLTRMLTYLRPGAEPRHFYGEGCGRRGVGRYEWDFLCGGGGWLIAMDLLDTFVDEFDVCNHYNKATSRVLGGTNSDVFISRCLAAEFNVTLSHRGEFKSQPPSAYVDEPLSNHYFFGDAGPVTFHYVRKRAAFHLLKGLQCDFSDDAALRRYNATTYNDMGGPLGG